MPWSTSLNCFIGYKWYQHDIKWNASYVWIHNCFVHALYCKHKIYSVRFSHSILHSSDLQYGVTDRHHSTTNSVGLAREHRLRGAHSHYCRLRTPTRSSIAQKLIWFWSAQLRNTSLNQNKKIKKTLLCTYGDQIPPSFCVCSSVLLRSELWKYRHTRTQARVHNEEACGVSTPWIHSTHDHAFSMHSWIWLKLVHSMLMSKQPQLFPAA